jgi:hypothetical protein
MFSRHTLAIATLTFAALGSLRHAAAQSGDSPGPYVCAGRPVEVVHSIRNLPGEIQVRLGFGRSGIDGLVDSADELNATDPTRPMRRFTWAAVNSDCIFAIIERGGSHFPFEVADFRHAPQEWPLENRWFSREAPTLAMVMRGVK